MTFQEGGEKRVGRVMGAVEAWRGVVGIARTLHDAQPTCQRLVMAVKGDTETKD